MITRLEPEHLDALVESGLVDDASAWATAPAGGDEHRWAAWRDGRIVGVVRLVAYSRLRRRHAGQVTAAGDAGPALAAAVRFADAWTPLDRLDLALPAHSPLLAAAQESGFELEVRRVGRLATGDEVGLGRLRPGFVPRAAGPMPAVPPRGRRRGAFTWRLVTEADLQVVRDLSAEPSVVWGTLQVETQNLPFVLARHRATPAGDRIGVLVDAASGEVAAMGGVHLTGVPGVYAVGMTVREAWQGCGVGHGIVEALLAEAASAGARRVELGVWHDNDRAQALYRAHGFRFEGRARWDAMRAGGHASSDEMAVHLR